MGEKQFNLAKMTWPIFVELMLQLLVGNMDQIMLSYYNDTAVASVGNANQVISMVIITFSTITLAATILISRFLGARREDLVKKVYSLGFYLNLVLGIIFATLVYFSASSVLSLMKIDSSILMEASSYLKIVGISMVFQALIMTFTAFLRANAHMKESMILTLVMNIVNVILNYTFIFGKFNIPEMGTSGAAVATLVSRVIGSIAIFIIFMKVVDNATISFKNIKPFPKGILSDILAIGVPSGGEALSYNLSQTVGLTFINTFGVYAATTRTYVYIFSNLCYLFALAVAQAGQVFISYLVGRGNIEKAEKQTYKILKLSIPVSVAVAILIHIFSTPLFKIFTTNPEILNLAKKVTLVGIFVELGRSCNIVLVRTLQAVGDVKYTVIIGVIFQW
ncbi:MAG: MATE family efflux transporter, partial [Tissierellia bacterium]|nr:MATE family efflux transporter [Tissierellia bacterium]